MLTSYRTPTDELSLEARLYTMAVKTPDGQLYKDNDSSLDVEQLPGIEHHVQSYLRNEGKELAAYLKDRHGKDIKLDAVGSAKLPEDVVAAVASNKYANVLLANRGFESKVRRMAANYGLSMDEGVTYVMSHEMVHAAGVHEETKVEGMLASYFTQQSAKYAKLAAAAPESLRGDHQKKADSYQRLAGAAKTRAALGEERLKGYATKN